MDAKVGYPLSRALAGDGAHINSESTGGREE